MAQTIQAYFDPRIKVDVSRTGDTLVIHFNQIDDIPFVYALVFENTPNDICIEHTLQSAPFTSAERTVVRVLNKESCTYTLKQSESKIRIVLFRQGDFYLGDIKSLTNMKILPRVYTTEVLFLNTRMMSELDPLWIDVPLAQPL